MEAPTTLADTAHADRTLDHDTILADSESEIVQAVACSPHLPDEQLSQWRALAHKGEHHDTCGKELFDPISTD